MNENNQILDDAHKTTIFQIETFCVILPTNLLVVHACLIARSNQAAFASAESLIFHARNSTSHNALLGSTAFKADLHFYHPTFVPQFLFISTERPNTHIDDRAP